MQDHSRIKISSRARKSWGALKMRPVCKTTVGWENTPAKQFMGSFEDEASMQDHSRVEPYAGHAIHGVL